ncbi:MAG TPA: succinic semialdehyde dehydrogenase [Thermoleophilaceae bacterium]|nr:succinic semialdehyde dehydrogenase [Thermoleophilaceae bacterium]
MAETGVKSPIPFAANGEAGEQIEVENPATGKVVGTVARMTAADVREVASRARAAQPGWEAMGYDGRAQVLLRAQKWLLDNSRRVIDTIVSETGKTYEDAQIAEIGYAAPAFGFWAKNAPRFLADERVSVSSPTLTGKRVVVRYRPLGVVGVIGPWNYPLTNSFGDCIPALAAGNAVILKPSEITPLTSLLMVEMLEECGLPADVYQVVTGPGDVGAELIDHVDFVMFTGSTATGRKVAERAARTLTPVSLELGGKDPMIVLRDADLEKAANAATWYSMQNGGQTCISVERVYVEEPVYDEFVKLVSQKVGKLRQGVPAGPGSVDVGAVTFAPQADMVDSHVKDAVAKGARVAVGGHLKDGPGRFYEPTVLLDVDHTMRCMTEETFGPTLPIMKVPDAEEAVRLANDSDYGLQASVWTKDVIRGEEIAARMESGVANVNEHQINYFVLEAPMGGWKQSGLGSRHGPDGIRKYARRQVSVISRVGLRRELFMFPYSKLTSKLLGAVLKLLHGRGKR